MTEVGVEPVDRDAEIARQHLRRDRIDQELGETRARRADRLQGPGRHVLDVLGQHLGDKAETGDEQGQHAGERAETEHLDEDDGDDDLVQGAGDDDDAASRQVDRPRRQVARGAKADRHRHRHAEEARHESHLNALADALHQQLPAGKVGREHAGEQVGRAGQAPADPRPVDLDGAERPQQVKHRQRHESAPRRRAADQARWLPAGRINGRGAHPTAASLSISPRRRGGFPPSSSSSPRAAVVLQSSSP